MSTYVKLARSTAEHYVRTGEAPPLPAALPTDLARQRACYVSILENPGRRLRCLAGSPLPHRASVAEEIVANTIAAITSQPHRHIRRQDLSYFTYRVALLAPLQRVSDPEHLNPQRFGLYVKSDKDKSAIILSQRLGIETANDQIGAALREAGIDPRQESVTMYRFEVTYFDE